VLSFAIVCNPHRIGHICIDAAAHAAVVLNPAGAKSAERDDPTSGVLFVGFFWWIFGRLFVVGV